MKIFEILDAGVKEKLEELKTTLSREKTRKEEADWVNCFAPWLWDELPRINNESLPFVFFE